MNRLEELVVQLEERALELGMLADLGDLELQELHSTYITTISAMNAVRKHPGETAKRLSKRLEAVRVELACTSQRCGAGMPEPAARVA